MVRRRDLCRSRRLAVRVPAADEPGQVIDVYVSARRDIATERRFFAAALTARGEPEEVVTDLAHALKHVIGGGGTRCVPQHCAVDNNRVECDDGRLKARLRMRGLKTDPTASVIISPHLSVVQAL